MRFLICDNEEEYVQDVERHINQYLFEHGITAEIHKYSNSKEMIDNIDHYDIAFLDIEMDGENGLKIGKKLQERNPKIVLIYITAYEHYLDEALDLGTTRFFDKPIDSQRFYKGLDKAINKVDNTEIQFLVQDGENGMITLNTSDIIYIETMGRKTKVVTKSRAYPSRDSIKVWKSRLTKSYFVSPHNSFIVNTNHITYFQKDHIILDGKHYIPVANAKRSDFRRKFLMSMER